MGVQGIRLPKADAAFKGIEIVALADARGSVARFAKNTNAPLGQGTLRISFKLAGVNLEYVLHPWCAARSDKAKGPQVVLYVAVNPRGSSRSGDYYVGPDAVDRFAERAGTFAVAAGELYGLSGNPRPYEIHTALMVDNIFKGRPLDALSSFGNSWREAFKDPSWYVAAAGALAAASMPGPPRPAIAVKAVSQALPAELDMIQMLSHEGAVERGLLVRELKGKYVIRAEGAADLGPGDFFNGPYDSLHEARAAAKKLASSDTALRQGNALPRTWPDGSQRGGASAQVVRVYQIEHDAPGFQTVAASQPESGTVMVRPQHLEAIRQGKPALAHEYLGGNTQLELPVKGMRNSYKIDIVKRVNGAEYRVTPDGTGF